MGWLDGMWDPAELGGPDLGNGNYGRGTPRDIDRQVNENRKRYEAIDEARTRRQLESDREYELRANRLKQDAERLAIEKGQAAATKWYNKQMVQLAKDKLKEERRQFDLSHQLEVQKFQDTSLQGWTDKALALSRTPKDYFTLMRMQQGVGDNIGNIPGLSWAAGGQLGNTTFNGQPQANSLANLHGNMGIRAGQGGSGSWASAGAEQANNMINERQLNLTPQQQDLYKTAREFAMNPQGAAPGWFENLDPIMRDMLQGAAEDQGLDWGSVVSRHRRSRWGGGGSSLAA